MGDIIIVLLVFWVVGKLWVNRVLREDCCHRLPLDEAQQIVLLDGIGLLEQLAQQSISRGMRPVGLWLALLFEEAEHRPWIVDFLLAKAVAVVPVVKDGQDRLLLLSMSQGAHFFWREADPIGIRPVDDAADLEVVEAAEDALFRNPQDTRQYGKIKGWIRLQRSTEEIPHESHAVLIEAVLPRLLDGDVVLIQQEDHRLVMVALHHVHEAAQGLLHLDG